MLYVNGSHEGFFHGLEATARNLGFEHCGYLVGVPLQGAGWRFVMMSNYPKSWQERYRRHGFYLIDPTIQHAKTSVSPLIWSSGLFERMPPGDLSEEARAAGFNHGWTQPVRDANGTFGALTLARREDAVTPEELDAKLRTMEWLAQMAHAVLFRPLLARRQNESITHLTEREIEFLRMAAEGKTAGDISEALGVTERTANFHIGNAMEKLGATNKTHAVALAMRLGLLD